MTRTLRPHRGFTLIELTIVMAVIAILAMMAMPSFRDRMVRQQVAEAMAGVEFVKQSVGSRHAPMATYPADNAAASVPPADRIVSRLVSSVTVRDGAVVMEFGNSADGQLKGKRLTLRPAHVPGYPQVPVEWVCAAGPVPDKMEVQGVDETDVPSKYLPHHCRPKPAPGK